MTPDVVVDIGNSRIKWGRCLRTVEDGGWVSLDPDDMNAWDDQAEAWQLAPGAWWAIGSVNPARTQTFTKWVHSTGGTAVMFGKPSELPITLAVDEPDRVGIDRVFGAIAARAIVPGGTPAITVDVGTAVTVNLIDVGGVFQGGAIFPGPRLMGLALRDHTAKLPLVDFSERPIGSSPGKNTTDAIRLGIVAALTGGVADRVRAFAAGSPVPPWLFLTGGGAHLLGTDPIPGVGKVRSVPALNLEGIRLAAEALP